MSKSGSDVLLIFQCFGTCPTPSQGDILTSIGLFPDFSPTNLNIFFSRAEIRAISELRVRLVPLDLLKLSSSCISFADSSKAMQILLIFF